MKAAKYFDIRAEGRKVILTEKKNARTLLRGIRVNSKKELIDRIYRYIDQVNKEPVAFRWKYKMDEIGV